MRVKCAQGLHSAGRPGARRPPAHTGAAVSAACSHNLVASGGQRSVLGHLPLPMDQVVKYVLESAGATASIPDPAN